MMTTEEHYEQLIAYEKIAAAMEDAATAQFEARHFEAKAACSLQDYEQAEREALVRLKMGAGSREAWQQAQERVAWARGNLLFNFVNERIRCDHALREAESAHRSWWAHSVGRRDDDRGRTNSDGLIEFRHGPISTHNTFRTGLEYGATSDEQLTAWDQMVRAREALLKAAREEAHSGTAA